MTSKEEILLELRKKFDEIKASLGFKATYEEINSISYIEDMALEEGYVSNQFSRQLINRMVETFYSWTQELYSWLMPAPYDIIHMHETKNLTSEERQEINKMISRIMYLARKTKRIAFAGLKREEESAFIDELVEFDKLYFNPFMLKYHLKFEETWR